MSISYNPTLAMALPWGSEALAVYPVARERAALSGRFITDAQRLIRPVYQIRSDRAGNLFFIYERTVDAQSGEGRFAVSVSVAADGSVRTFDLANEDRGVPTQSIIDFCPDHAGGIYVLDRLEKAGQGLEVRLRRIDSEGRTRWAVLGTLDMQQSDLWNLRGRFEYLIAPTQNSLFLPPRYPQHGVAGINVESGSVQAVYDWDEPYDRMAISAAHDVYFGRFISDSSGGRQVLVKRNLEDKDARTVIESEIQYLHNLAGVDDSGAIYARLHDGIARLSPTGQVEWKQAVHGIVVRESDQHIFLCSQNEHSGDVVNLAVEHYDPSGKVVQQLAFRLPQEQAPDAGTPFNLVHVDVAARCTFYAGESESQAGTLFTYAPDGALQTMLDLAHTGADGFPSFDRVNGELLPLESQMGTPSMFDLDYQGNMYITLSDPTGFKVVRFAPATLAHTDGHKG